MIKGYLNQTANWHQATGVNSYGEPTFAESKSIKVRWEGRRRLVRDKEGREVVSEALVFCTDSVEPDDTLEYGGRTWPVINVSLVPSLDGSDSHREVSV